MELLAQGLSYTSQNEPSLALSKFDEEVQHIPCEYGSPSPTSAMNEKEENDSDDDHDEGPPVSRGCLWDAVLQRSLDSGDVDRISAAIGLAEKSGASAEMLSRAYGEWRRIAEAALVSAIDASSEAPSNDMQIHVKKLTLAVDQAVEAGVSVDVVQKARTHLRSLKGPQRSSSSRVPASQGAASEVLVQIKPTSPSKLTAIQESSEAPVAMSPGTYFRQPGHERSVSPGRQSSPCRVVPEVFGRSVSEEMLEAGFGKPSQSGRKRSKSPVGKRFALAQGKVAERVRHIQNNGDCTLQ
jgi:hypothetical protein